MPQFRKKPVVIDAHRFTGWEGLEPVFDTEPSGWLLDAMMNGTILCGGHLGRSFVIQTLEGHLNASVGDWIIRGVNNEIYPCKPDVFDKTYEPV